MGGLGGLEALGSGFPGTGHARSHTVSTAASRLSEKRGEAQSPAPLRTYTSYYRRQVGGHVTCWERGIGCPVAAEALRPGPGFLSGDPDLGWSGGAGELCGRWILSRYFGAVLVLVSKAVYIISTYYGVWDDQQRGRDGSRWHHVTSRLGGDLSGFTLPHYHSALRSIHGVFSLPFCTLIHVLSSLPFLSSIHAFRSTHTHKLASPTPTPTQSSKANPSVVHPFPHKLSRCCDSCCNSKSKYHCGPSPLIDDPVLLRAILSQSRPMGLRSRCGYQYEGVRAIHDHRIESKGNLLFVRMWVFVGLLFHRPGYSGRQEMLQFLIKS